MTTIPTPEELRSLLRYDPETGKLYWLPRPAEMFSSESHGKTWNTRHAGSEAFLTPHCGGYRYGKIHNRNYSAHRVAYAIHHGEWPREQIDHVNGVRDDNRIENLRAASEEMNSRNRVMSPRNTSGVNGVYWSKQRKKWVAQIKVNGKLKSLGRFDDINDAVAARKTAEEGHGFTERHGAAL